MAFKHIVPVFLNGQGMCARHVLQFYFLSLCKVPNEVDLGYMGVGCTSTATITLQNHGSIGMPYSWETPPCITITPADGTLPPGAKRVCRVQCKPLQAQIWKCTATCKTSSTVHFLKVGTVPTMLCEVLPVECTVDSASRVRFGFEREAGVAEDYSGRPLHRLCLRVMSQSFLANCFMASSHVLGWLTCAHKRLGCPVDTMQAVCNGLADQWAEQAGAFGPQQRSPGLRVCACISQQQTHCPAEQPQPCARSIYSGGQRSGTRSTVLRDTITVWYWTGLPLSKPFRFSNHFCNYGWRAKCPFADAKRVAQLVRQLASPCGYPRDPPISCHCHWPCPSSPASISYVSQQGSATSMPLETADYSSLFREMPLMRKFRLYQVFGTQVQHIEDI